MVSDRWICTFFAESSSNKYTIIETVALSEMSALFFIKKQIIAQDLTAYKRRQTPYFV
jgi:hypothetical protein